ncbi:hypothetical protein ACQ4PT_055074 [Festuca glaucescens]
MVLLERRLDGRRGALKEALGPNPAPVTLSNENTLLKVATLELEINHLERHLTVPTDTIQKSRENTHIVIFRHSPGCVGAAKGGSELGRRRRLSEEVVMQCSITYVLPLERGAVIQ